jgi:hypothetical protein
MDWRRFTMVVVIWCATTGLVFADDHSDSGSMEVAANASLCSPTEVAIFACEVKRNVASICASTNLSATNGYIQYRFGTREKVTFEYPEKKTNPRRAFSPESTRGHHGGHDSLKFVIGSYTYIAAHDWSGNVDEHSVVVKRVGKAVRKLHCHDFRYGEPNLTGSIELLHHAGLNED